MLFILDEVMLLMLLVVSMFIGIGELVMEWGVLCVLIIVIFLMFFLVVFFVIVEVVIVIDSE